MPNGMTKLVSDAYRASAKYNLSLEDIYNALHELDTDDCDRAGKYMADKLKVSKVEHYFWYGLGVSLVASGALYLILWFLSDS